MSDALNLLVIEDTRADFLLLERHLKLDGLSAKCQQVTNPDGLRQALQANNWDAVLTDYKVPGMNFSETLSDLQQYRDDLPVILVSGSLGEEVAVDLLKQGVWDFVLKDRLARLAPAIERALNEARTQRARRESDTQLVRLNRLYALLGGINEIIVRCHDRQQLFNECCRIAVEQGGFLLAWVGQVDPVSHAVKVDAWSGEGSDYLKRLKIRVTGDDPRSRGPTGRALWEGKTTICNDIAHDERMSPWREQALCMGYHASASFPLKQAGEVRYALSLYADKMGFFDDAELSLLNRLSDNLGYALDAIDSETKRRQMEAALHHSEEWSRQIIDSVPDSVLVLNQDGRIIRANKQVERMFGYPPAELRDQGVETLLMDQQREHYARLCADQLTESAQQRRMQGLQVAARHNDGRVFPVEISLNPLQTKGQVQLIVTIHDITERKASEDLIRRDREQQATLRKLLETTLSGTTLEETLMQCLQQLLKITWLSILPKGGIFLFDPDGQELHLVVSQGLGPQILSLCDRVPLGHCICGRAAATGETQYTQCVDELHDVSYPGMEDHGHYSLPLLSNGELLGVLVLYLPPGFEHDAPKEQFIASAADILAGYLSRKQHEERLRRDAAVLESTHEGVMVTELDGRIVGINPAFTKITGYSETDILGKTPSVLRSQHHDATFYHRLWAAIDETGHWQGEIWNRRKNGEVFPEWLTISAVRDESDLITNYVGVFSDISQIKDAEERLSYLAHHDALTGLPNRLQIRTLLNHALDRAQREGHVLAVLFMDLDHFKHINDSLGHAAGDELLRIGTDRLIGRLRDSDTIGRLGGDEFVLMLEELRNTDDAANVAQGLIELFREPIRLSNGQEVYVGASVGISVFPDDGNSADQLIRNADTAMYQAKDGGRNTYRFYTEGLTQRAEKRLFLEGRLRHALEKDEMLLHYQPLVNDGHCIGVEALVRWQDPEVGLVSPMEFIPLAEETRVIIPLGDWVLRTACAQMKAWLDDGLSLKTMAVNLSPVQFQQSDFVQQVHEALVETGLSAEYLELEITEGTLMLQVEETEAKLAALQRLGIRLAIDDFGTGYSSLAYLKRFPIHKLKIDQSFVRDLPDNSASMEIVSTIIAMARNLKLEVLAEGVETPAQLSFLNEQGCDTFQGYIFSRPVQAEEIPAILMQAFY